MSGIASTLNEKQMKKLAKYFSKHEGIHNVDQGRVASKN
jgi:cytochrome c553